jgi:excinuclease ABC subunit A
LQGADGLHVEDVRNLVDVLYWLVDQGNTMLEIEHNLDVIKTADWVIDLGPEGGTGGGKVVAMGTPEEVAAVEGSWTGKYLKGILLMERGQRTCCGLVLMFWL